jgi:hypothetical protein
MTNFRTIIITLHITGNFPTAYVLDQQQVAGIATLVSLVENQTTNGNWN